MNVTFKFTNVGTNQVPQDYNKKIKIIEKNLKEYFRYFECAEYKSEFDITVFQINTFHNISGNILKMKTDTNLDMQDRKYGVYIAIKTDNNHVAFVYLRIYNNENIQLDNHKIGQIINDGPYNKKVKKSVDVFEQKHTKQPAFDKEFIIKAEPKTKTVTITNDPLLFSDEDELKSKENTSVNTKNSIEPQESLSSLVTSTNNTEEDNNKKLMSLILSYNSQDKDEFFLSKTSIGLMIDDNYKLRVRTQRASIYRIVIAKFGKKAIDSRDNKGYIFSKKSIQDYLSGKAELLKRNKSTPLKQNKTSKNRAQIMSLTAQIVSHRSKIKELTRDLEKVEDLIYKEKQNEENLLEDLFKLLKGCNNK